MTIDLGACIGCGACSIACQSENNIPTVGKEDALNGRSLHWMRIDRYQATQASTDTAESASQALSFVPVPCQHCEDAPCEPACPISAIAQGSGGLNELVYNRCRGHKNCVGSCAYQVHRFNHRHYQRRAEEKNPLLVLQRNPNVTVRGGDVMEKCTYCVQRIAQVRIATKRAGGDVIADGQITPACAQTCPTSAILFGNVADRSSKVARSKQLERHFVLLEEEGSRPRTTYLAKLRNPNRRLL